MENITFHANSLSEYLSIISSKDIGYGKCYYRGENQKYPCIDSSLVRHYKTKEHKLPLSRKYKSIISDYYEEIGAEINQIQKDYFLAFSQHHRLMTNLIDFTTAPLVALYFACEKESYLSENDIGYVYILNNTSTIDATDLLNKYSFSNIGYVNIFNTLSEYRYGENSKLMFKEFKNLLNDYCADTSIPVSILKEIRDLCLQSDFTNICKEFLSAHDEIFRNCLSEPFSISSDEGITTSLSQEKNNEQLFKFDFFELTLNLIKKYLPDYSFSGDFNIDLYLVLLLLYLNDIIIPDYKIGNSKSPKFPPFPYLIYRTPLKFDRIKNQCGVFVYQCFIEYQPKSEPLFKVIPQPVKPDISIQIHNQKDIIKELDQIGINKRFIYGDFDSTAQYINQRHLYNF